MPVTNSEEASMMIPRVYRRRSSAVSGVSLVEEAEAEERESVARTTPTVTSAAENWQKLSCQWQKHRRDGQLTIWVAL